MAWGRRRRATWLVVAAGAAAAASARARRMMTVVDGSSRSETGGGNARVMFELDALGPKGTKREGLRYYATAFLAATQFGRDSSSVLEIGCASNAFVGRMTWIAEEDVRRAVSRRVRERRRAKRIWDDRSGIGRRRRIRRRRFRHVARRARVRFLRVHASARTRGRSDEIF